MTRFSTAKHHLIEAIRWDPSMPAERINDFLLMSRGTSNSYVVTSGDGDVVINCGTPYQGDRHRARFEERLGRKLEVRKILLTQNHFDHVGGWSAFADPGSETIVQRSFPLLVRERETLGSFFMPRARQVLSALMPPIETVRVPLRNPRELVDPTLFADDHAFEQGERRFELHSTPSGETLDSMIVWLPAEKTLFTGNWMGALYGALPHFYTLRGDRQRSVSQFLRDLDWIIALEPRMLVTGHDEPIVGSERIAADMNKLRDAVRYIHDETVRGMNEHKKLSTLMREIALPKELDMAPGRGPVRWYVRAVWEEYSGWFLCERTSELYAEPPSAIWGELAEMVGGVDALTARAKQHLADGQPLAALHFVEIAVSVDPGHRGAREAEVGVLEKLIDDTEGQAFDELGWLETQLTSARAALAR